jgi:predicted MFS family arabinose efflux permease
MAPAEPSNARKLYTLILLALAASVSNADRTVIGVLQEPIRHEFHLSDTQLGLVTGMSFALAYSLISLPFGVLADRVERSRLLAGCMAIWSVMTAVCGLAGSFVQLLMARFAVGAGEAAGAPATISMVSDIYSTKRRGTALAVYYLAIPIGSTAAMAAGGLIAEAHGWRAAFLAAAVPGLVLSLLIVLTLRAPPRRTALGAAVKAPPLREVIGFIRSQRSLLQLIIAVTIAQLVANAIGTWAPSFFIRYHDMSVREVGLVLGPVSGAVGVVGMLASGALADWLGRGDLRRTLGMIVGALLLLTPALVLAFAMKGVVSALAGFSLYLLLSYLVMPATMAVTQSLAGPARRATVAALVLTTTSFMGSGMGPLLTGATSDLLRPYVGADSLRWSMLAFSLLGIWAALHVVAAMRTCREDLARAEAEYPSRDDHDEQAGVLPSGSPAIGAHQSSSTRRDAGK